MAILNAFSGGSGVRIPLEPITNLVLAGRNQAMLISWTDPVDKVASPGGETCAQWGFSLVVRKEGSAPTSPTDGVQVVKTSVRNQYQSTTYTDTGLVNGTTYYYAVFAFTTLGVASDPVTANERPRNNSVVYDTMADPFREISWGRGATSIGDYGIFFGGHIVGDDNDGSSWVDAYSSSLTRSPIQNASYTCYNPTFYANDHYAAFAYNVGPNISQGNEYGRLYNPSLTYRNVQYYRNWAFGNRAVAATENYIIFAGGGGRSTDSGGSSSIGAATNHVTYVDPYGAVTSGYYLPGMKNYALGGRIGEYGLIMGGTTRSEYNDHLADSSVYSVDDSLTWGTATSLAYHVRQDGSITATVSDHLLVASKSSGVTVYDTSLTRTTTDSLSQGASWLASATAPDLAVFIIGNTTVMNVYDIYLTRSIGPALQSSKYFPSAVSIGYKVLVGGSQTNADVEVYDA